METTRGKIAFRDWLRWYLGAVVGAVALSFGLAWLLSIHPLRAGFGVSGMMFIAAALELPPMAFHVLRNTGWFAYVRSDTTIRLIIGAIALWLVVAALFLPGIFVWPQ